MSEQAFQQCRCLVTDQWGEKVGSITFIKPINAPAKWQVYSVEGFLPVDKEDTPYRVKKILMRRKLEWQWIQMPYLWV